MPRGAASPVGAVRNAPNGYDYTKTEDRGWVLNHWLVWEEANGRQVDPSCEQIRFKDGNRRNLSPDNLICVPKGTQQLRAKIARLEATIADLQAQLRYYNNELAKASGNPSV